MTYSWITHVLLYESIAGTSWYSHKEFGYGRKFRGICVKDQGGCRESLYQKKEKKRSRFKKKGT